MGTSVVYWFSEVAAFARNSFPPTLVCRAAFQRLRPRSSGRVGLFAGPTPGLVAECTLGAFAHRAFGCFETISLE